MPKIHHRDQYAKFKRSLKTKQRTQKAKTPESTIQAQVEGYLNAYGLFYIRIPDALNRCLFAYNPHLKGRELGERKRISEYLKGLPDLTILKDGRYLAIELKTDIGKLSGAQKVWRDAIGTVVCRSFEEAKEKIDQWRAEVE